MARSFRVIELASVGAPGGQTSLVSNHVPATQSAADIQSAYDAAYLAAAGSPKRTILTLDT